ncbi:UBX domain-containing protein 11 isoform X3 [Pseudophryne corroboree]|uniref:UBX domain-containing protein 11 isoform X3 n=1 Tax=Pseudophryne corroboree TaxID=495146 RepID=UPI003081B9F0
MSSPLMTLGKPRRTSILHGQRCHHGGRRSAPFKDMPVYLVASLPSSNMLLQEKGNHSLGKGLGSVPSDFDLLSTTVKRVSELETRVRLQKREIQLKDQEIATLEQKIKQLERQRTDHSVEEKHDQALEKRCQELQKRVSDMEQFLCDYGLYWVGDEYSADASKQETHSSSSGHTSHTFHIDFDLILENLKDLNVLGGDGVSHIEYKGGAARLRPPEPLPLTLYSNGIIMFQGPFRSYQEASTQQCLRDIMDGYFPSELQTRFPDGVPFQVTDMRNVVFHERRPWDEFPGTGQSVGGAEGHLRETSNMNGPRLSVEQFLSRLPKSIIHGGRVLDIQGPIREALQGSNSEEMLSESIVDSPLVVSVEKMSQTNTVFSNLRIKSENGDHTYKVRMLPTETLGDLRAILAQHRVSDVASFDIISSFPYCVYDNNTCTLQEAGLVPNASLFLRRKNLREPGELKTTSVSKTTGL